MFVDRLKMAWIYLIFYFDRKLLQASQATSKAEEVLWLGYISKSQFLLLHAIQSLFDSWLYKCSRVPVMAYYH